VTDDVKTVAGVPIDRLAHRLADTLLFTYDLARSPLMASSVRSPERSTSAMRSRPTPPDVVQYLRDLHGFGVASAGELLIALDTAGAARWHQRTGPGQRPAGLTKAVAAGVTVEMESETEALLAHRHRRRATIADRPLGWDHATKLAERLPCTIGSTTITARKPRCRLRWAEWRKTLSEATIARCVTGARPDRLQARSSEHNDLDAMWIRRVVVEAPARGRRLSARTVKWLRV
jgi:hypothetical protein